MSYRGIDVSHYNQPINWDQVKNQIDFAILKLGNIGDNTKFWLDNTFESNYENCKRLGIPIGVYVYCYCNSPENSRIAGEQVREYLSDKPLELPIYIDMEDKEIKVEGKDKLTEIVIAFNSEIEKACKWAGIYANLDWFKNYLNKDLLCDKYTSWIAHIDYTNNQNKYEGQYDMFQYSWEGKIEGCNGNNGEVDMNIMYRDLISEIAGTTPNIVNQNLGGNGYYPRCNLSYKSLVDALDSINVNSSFDFRKKIATTNGIYNYTGTASQNQSLLVKLKAGRLKRP